MKTMFAPWAKVGLIIGNVFMRRRARLGLLGMCLFAVEVLLLPGELRFGPTEQDAIQPRPLFTRATAHEPGSASAAVGASLDATRDSARDPGRDVASSRHGLPDTARGIAPAGLSNRAGAELGLGESGPVALTREQRAVARFIADKYRRDLPSVESMVLVAYQAARQVRVDPLLVLAIISVESGFDPGAQSRRGAQGLMQVRTRVHAERFEPFGGRVAAFDPWANIHVGSSILKDYLRREGSVEGALKSYVGAAQRSDDGGYGAKVLGERARLAAAARGAAPLARTGPDDAVVVGG